MKHFLSIADLSRQQVEHLLQRALFFKQKQQFPVYPHHALANLFYENSTRTRISFELAAKNLSMEVVNVDLSTSSETKGEGIDDTIQTLAAMGITLFAIRHSEDGLPEHLAKGVNVGVHVINAGDGKHAHPSQAMLDLMTIVEKKPNLASLKIVIVGDIRHSRVANSLQCLFKLMQVGELVLVAPKPWQPEIVHYGHVTADLSEALQGADVVIGLRVQKERLAGHEQLDLAQYRAQFALTEDAVAMAKPDAIIMHPGPINRGIEIDTAVADGLQSVILTQVQNGVYMRMAILESMVLN
ncbi:MAG: aspartate carbamoyltransferase [Legionellales bacterium RIFCSPHIGHO2_12_FULL_42_9]|nr:MAG: aspartate carbamoyltransferase [Legionellales bacterium RIFCSPHIGHO2_12_FULL_42_9]